MQSLFHAGRLIAILLAGAVLSSCIEDSAGIMTPENAVLAPGLTGAWISGGGARQALIARTGVRSYTVTTRTDGHVSHVYTGVHLTPLKEGKHTYLVSLPAQPEDPKQPQRLLFVLKLRTNSFEMRFPSDERLAAMATQAGVRLDRRILTPAASKSDVLKLMTAIAKPSFEGGYVYTRQGWFNAPKDAFTLEQAAALRSANKHTEAADMLAYLALRGSAEAQVRLADMATTGSGIKKNPMGAAWFLLEAQRSGHPEAARMLGTHLQKHPIDNEAVFKTPVYWFAIAAVQSNSPDARHALEGAAKIDCAALMAAPDSKWKSLAACTDGIAQYESLRATVALDLESTEEGMAELYVEIERIEEKDRAIQREIDDTKREVEKLKGEIRQQR